jgi:hypothetical protein
MRAAAMAAVFISKHLDHPCEWKGLTDIAVKGIIHRSASDQSLRLFGYRWVFLDDLRNDRVQFTCEATNCQVEMIDNTGSYLFQSVEDALSFSALPKNVLIDSIRCELSTLEPGPQFTVLAGRSWRIVDTGNQPASISTYEAPGGTISDITLNSKNAANGNFLSQLLPSNVVFVKEELVTRRKLAGFATIQATFLDWLRTFFSSPFIPESTMTMDHFCKFYLNGDRNIDGIIWRNVLPSEQLPPTKEANQLRLQPSDENPSQPKRVDNSNVSLGDICLPSC